MIAAVEDVVTGPPGSDLDPYALDVLRSPYAFQHALREAGPVVRLERYDVLAVGRFNEATEILSDWGRFTNSGGVGIQDIRKPGNFRIPSMILEVDPPDHDKAKAPLMKLLSPDRLKLWRESFARAAAELVDDLLDRKEVDGVEDIAQAFVFRVFPGTVGVQLPREPTLVIGEMRFNQSGPPNALYHAAIEAAQPYLAWFENSVQREAVVPGGISELLFDLEDDGVLAPGLASNLVRSFVGGGTDSTISGIGTTLAGLASSPDQWALLHQNPGKARAAFEEGIRFDPPFQVTYRTTVCETELAGHILPPDTKIGVFLGAANRDPERWENPDRFDISRPPRGIAFGHGIHMCIGQMIARLEADAILTALAKKVSRFELAGEPSHRPMNQVRTLERLPVRLIAA